MYTKLTKLSDASLLKLQLMAESVPMTDKDRRVGANGYSRLSVYNYSKWYNWTREQKQEFKDCFPAQYVENALIGWFLKFPKTTGFLDLMTYWVNNPMSGIVVAYALENQEIVLNGVKVSVLKGEGIVFDLSVPHEVKNKTFEQKWACLMLLSLPA